MSPNDHCHYIGFCPLGVEECGKSDGGNNSTVAANSNLLDSPSVRHLPSRVVRPLLFLDSVLGFRKA